MHTYSIVVRSSASRRVLAIVEVRTPNGPRYAVEGGAPKALDGLRIERAWDGLGGTTAHARGTLAVREADLPATRFEAVEISILA